MPVEPHERGVLSSWIDLLGDVGRSMAFDRLSPWDDLQGCRFEPRTPDVAAEDGK